jgi:excisionase family DNA binding protein
MDKNTGTKIGVTEAAQLLGVDTRTIHRRILRGELTAEKLNGGLRAAYLLERSEVEAKAAAND